MDSEAKNKSRKGADGQQEQLVFRGLYKLQMPYYR